MPPGHLLADVFPTCSDGRSQTEDTLKDYLSLCQLDSNWCLPKRARREDILDYSAPHTRPGQGKEIQIPSNHNKYIDQVKSIAVLSGFELWLFFSTRFTHNAGRQKKKKKRQTTSASEVIADLFIVSDTHLSLPLSLMQYGTVPELHAVKENLIYTYKTRH